MAASERVLAHQAGVAGARPYGTNGNMPADAVRTTYSVHGNATAVRYISDVPFEQPYAERPTCAGTRTNGTPCKAKAEAGEAFCKPHSDQG